MPLYEYKCNSCGKIFEVIEKFSDEPLKTHAECGGAVERLISAPAFHLKGTGWYATDYAKGNGGKPAEAKTGESKADGDSSKSETKASETKTETKPAATESKPSTSTTDSK